mmetsp:Transcript_42191/g.164858  ORF Transcript_42191/g.164858 Transcript_42191/m.164858 type:complete len:437 (-) Transcript_42191:700-2010(-)
MASMVCFPFKKERIDVVLRNVRIAAKHSRTSVVLLVAAGKNETYEGIAKEILAIEQENGKKIILKVQERVGSLRPGKGDGMNSALKIFHDYRPKLERLHFYDADIESFSPLWISKAEDAADLEYDLVRHYFPRSSTDAQITWQVTRVGFSLLWPHKNIAHIQQPLGGELLMSRRAVKVFLDSPEVMERSDWGIDTMYTFAAVKSGLSINEIYVPQGKLHALYGGLRDLKTMLIECFNAVQTIKKEIIDTNSVHHVQAAEAVPVEVREKIGYDIEKSLELLRENWTTEQESLLKLFPDRIASGLMSARNFPKWGFMDEVAWVDAYRVLLDNFDKDNEDWCELLFKLWVSRVIHYTMRHVLRGYDAALSELNAMVRNVQLSSGKRVIQKRRELVKSSPLIGQPPSPTTSYLSATSEEQIGAGLGLGETPPSYSSVPTV